MMSVAAIRGEQDAASTGRDQEATPQRAVTVEHATRGKMLRGRERDRQRRGARALPPIDFLHLTDARRPEQAAVTDWCHQPRLKPPIECAQRPEIAVIVVIVTQDHE